MSHITRPIKQWNRVHALTATDLKHFLYFSKTLIQNHQIKFHSRSGDPRPTYYRYVFETEYLEYVDFLFSFQRYEKIEENLRLVLSAPTIVLSDGTTIGMKVVIEKAMMRLIACHYLQNEREQVRKNLDTLDSSDDEATRFMCLYWRKLFGIAVEPKPRLQIKLHCLLEYRFNRSLSKTSLEKLIQDGCEKNIFFRDAVATDQNLFANQWSVWLDFFPEDPIFQILAALQVISESSGQDNRNCEILENEFRKALFVWPEFWFLLICDPMFSRFAPTKKLLPAADGGRLHLYGIYGVIPPFDSPNPHHFVLNEDRPEIHGLLDSQLFHISDATGPASLSAHRDLSPPFTIQMRQFPDQIFGPYSEVLNDIRSLATGSNDTWFFIKDIYTNYVDEIMVEHGRLGIKRWRIDEQHSGLNLPLSSLAPYLPMMKKTTEPRFKLEAFLSFSRKIEATHY